MKAVDRQALAEWEKLLKDIRNSTPTEDLSPSEVERRRTELEKNPIEWMKFFFPKYAKYPFAPFHLKAIDRLTRNAEWYEVLSWSRELAKSTVVMFVVMYLVMTKRKRNVLLASATAKSAAKLLAPYRANFEANGRLKQFYGDQISLGHWEEEDFLLKNGASFVGFGAGSAPRGTKNEEVRPDIFLVDDFDTDEKCRNPEIIEKDWDWIDKAFLGARSVSEPTLVVFCGNIIAEDCIITRAGAMADHWDVVNIRDEHGRSTWPTKNTEEHIDRVLSKRSKRSVLTEYFNNPVSEGEIFPRCNYGSIPALKKFNYLIIYGDPAPGESKKKGASFKAVWLCGMLAGKMYVIKGFLDRALNTTFIEWYVELLRYVGGATNVYCYMENNKLQDPFFRQVFKPACQHISRESGIALNIKGDELPKTDKASRIETNLEPLNSNGDLILNIKEQDNPHMKELEFQFKSFKPHLPYPADGPDCIEGAYRMLKIKHGERQPILVIPRGKVRKNNQRQ